MKVNKIEFELVPDSIPTQAIWQNIYIIKVSDVGKEFEEWLSGQTRPHVVEHESPSDWAYYSDYLRWSAGLRVID